MSQFPSADKILDLVRTFQSACILTAAADLDIFTALSDGPMTARLLSQKIHTDRRATTILLDALAGLGFLAKNKNCYRVPPQMAKLLTEASSANILPAIRHQANCLRRWVQLARVVQTGKPAQRMPSIRGARADLAAFIGAMDNFASPISAEIIGKLQPLKFHHLLDIGGASGSWTIAFLKAAPSAAATLFDLPAVIPLARKRIADAGLAKRVELVAGDYNCHELPKGADFAWLSAIAHQNSREQNRSLFARINSALLPGGILVIRDVVMDPSRASPRAGALFAVNMLVSTDSGSTYTFDEFRQDLSQAGFTRIKLVHRDQFTSSLISARKPAEHSRT